MALTDRFLSALVVVANVGTLLYLGALEAMLWVSINYGHATLAFDWLEPFEFGFVLPFLMLTDLFVGLRELKRLAS